MAISSKLVRETVKSGKCGKIKINSDSHAIFKLFFFFDSEGMYITYFQICIKNCRSVYCFKKYLAFK